MVIIRKHAIALLALLAALWAGQAYAHGKPMALGGVDVAAGAYDAGARLEPVKGVTADGVSWLQAMNAAGQTLGHVGVTKEVTDHGFLAQATALDNDGRVINVFVLRVMADEKAQVEAMTATKSWWLEDADINPEGAALILLKSVWKVAGAFTKRKAK